MGGRVRGNANAHGQSQQHVLETHKGHHLAAVTGHILVVRLPRVHNIIDMPPLFLRQVLHTVFEEIVSVVLGGLTELLIHHPVLLPLPKRTEQQIQCIGSNLPQAHRRRVVLAQRAITVAQHTLFAKIREQNMPAAGVCLAVGKKELPLQPRVSAPQLDPVGTAVLLHLQANIPVHFL